MQLSPLVPKATFCVVIEKGFLVFGTERIKSIAFLGVG